MQPSPFAYGLTAGLILTRQETIGFMKKIPASGASNVTPRPHPFQFPTVWKHAKPENLRRSQFTGGRYGHSGDPERTVDIAQRALYDALGLEVFNLHPYNVDIVPMPHDYQREQGMRITPIWAMQVVNVDGPGVKTLKEACTAKRAQAGKAPHALAPSISFLDKSQFAEIAETAHLPISTHARNYLDVLYEHLKQGRILPTVAFSIPQDAAIA